MPIEFSETILQNDDFKVETDGNGDLVQTHKQTGAQFKFDSTKMRWIPVEGLDLQSADISNVGSLDTDELRHVADHIIETDDDADSILKNDVESDDVVYLETGTHDVSDPQLPDGVTILGPGATLKKAADGAILSFGNSFRLGDGITLDGNKANYTGDGMVPREWDLGNISFSNGFIQNCDGSPLVLDGTHTFKFDRVDFRDSDDYAVRCIDTGGDVPHRGKFENCRVRDSLGGVDLQDGARKVDFQLRTILGTEGTGVEEHLFNVEGTFRSCTLPKADHSRIGGCFMLVNDANANVIDVQNRMDVNQAAQSPPNALTSPVAQIHLESYNSFRMQTTAGRHGGGSNSPDEYIHDSVGDAKVEFLGGVKNDPMIIRGTPYCRVLSDNYDDLEIHLDTVTGSNILIEGPANHPGSGIQVELAAVNNIITFNDQVKIRNLRITDEVDLQTEKSQVKDCSVGAGSITVSADQCIIQGCHSANVSFATGTANGTADALYGGSSVSDPDGNNEIGTIG